ILDQIVHDLLHTERIPLALRFVRTAEANLHPFHSCTLSKCFDDFFRRGDQVHRLLLQLEATGGESRQVEEASDEVSEALREMSRAGKLSRELSCVVGSRTLGLEHQQGSGDLKLESIEWCSQLVGRNRQKLLAESNRFLRMSQAN